MTIFETCYNVLKTIIIYAVKSPRQSFNHHFQKDFSKPLNCDVALICFQTNDFTYIYCTCWCSLIITLFLAFSLRERVFFKKLMSPCERDEYRQRYPHVAPEIGKGLM